MVILALDTSSAAGSAAIARGGIVLLEREGDGSRTHGERLPRELMSILHAAGVSLLEVDRFAVATGPGSFTGLRVGIATTQGLALAQRKLVCPVSSFEACAAIGARPDLPPPTSHLRSPTSDLRPPTSDLVAVWIDAHRGEVFGALYDGQGRVERQPPTSLPPDATLDGWERSLHGAGTIRFVGDGAVRYADVIRARLGQRAVVPDVAPVLAGAIAAIAAEEPARAVHPHAVVPIYVRRSDAELARDRRRVKG
jgi:tRNA threonylcarbamoyladenosine biosynthesis protein TsaB